MTAVANSLIVLDEAGRAWIEGANTKVIEVAMDHSCHGWDADEIHKQHEYLSMAQIYAALSHYYEHKSEYDAAIESMGEEVAKMRQIQGASPFAARMKRLGKLP
jgi:uncharacterized protein (DUF433 family)